MHKQIPTTTELVPFWDRAAEQKSFTHPVPAEIRNRFFPPRGKVLDLGCGYGRLARDLSQDCYVVSCVDASSAMLESAKRLAPACEFRQWKNELPWEADTFDVAVLVTLLTSVPAEADQRKLLAEVVRTIKPGGHLFVSDMPLQWSSRYTERYKLGYEKYQDYGVFDLPDGNTVRHHSLPYFLDLVSDFELILLQPHQVVTMNGNPAEAFRYVGQLA